MKLRFHLCACGSCTHPEWSCIRDGSLRKATFPAYCAVIVHPEHGLILFDTGYASHLTDALRKFPYRLYPTLFPFTIPPGEDVTARLNQLGYDKGDVKWIVISHFHPDHIAGLKDFPAARFIASRTAWEFLQGKKGWGALRQGLIPDLLPPDMAGRLDWFEDKNDLNLQDTLPGFTTGKDLFGCGSLLAVTLPGHAIGQHGLYLRDCGDGRPVFMIADACWRSRSYQRLILPPAITMATMHDPAAYRETLLKIHRLSLTRNDIAIIPSHCQDAALSFDIAAA